MVHSCPVVSRSRTSLKPTVVRVITVMYKASMKLQPSRTMYPSTPTTVITPSARRAFRARRTVLRISYGSEIGKRLLGSTRPDFAIKLIIATP